MSKNQDLKKDKVNEFKKMIDGKSLVFVDYEGIVVEDISSIRNELRDDGGVFRVLKNTLLKRVVVDKKLEIDDSLFKGMTATAVVENDKFINVGKSILKAEKAKKITIKGGFFEGNFLDSDGVRKYASLMSKEELYGVLVGCFQGVVSNLVFTLDEIGKQKLDDSGESASVSSKNE